MHTLALLIRDPRLDALIERLRRADEDWYARGREDGLAWSLAYATRTDLRRAAELADVDGNTLGLSLIHDEEAAVTQKRPPALPGFEQLGDVWTRQRRWVLRDLGLDAEPADDDDASTAVQRALEQADDAAYLEGWCGALCELWAAASPALR